MAEPETGRRGSSRVLVTFASALLSALLHGSVLAAALIWIERKPGTIAPPTEAISIELLETEVLEVVETTIAATAMASLESVQSSPGATTESAAASTKAASELQPVEPAEQVEVKEAVLSEADAPQGIDVLKGALETDAPVGIVRPDVKPAAKPSESPARETKERKKPTRTAKLTEPTETRKADSEARKKGGASSRAARGSTSSSGRVSASTGSAINYAALVRARVAARKPAGGGRRGTVVIAFGVTRSGGMSFASIARSSGDPGLDRSVLSAVRGAGPFPAPPPGAGLRFAIPFYFR